MPGNDHENIQGNWDIPGVPETMLVVTGTTLGVTGNVLWRTGAMLGATGSNCE